MRDHVPSIELCKRLKELGFNKETVYFYEGDGDLVTHVAGYKLNFEDDYPAPIATEILEELPRKLERELWKDDVRQEVEYFTLQIYAKGKDGRQHTVTYNGLNNPYFFTQYEAESLPDALAKMWIYLKENKLI